MYAQLQSYQHGAAATTSQAGLTWDGHAWVAATPAYNGRNVASSYDPTAPSWNHATPQQPQQPSTTMGAVVIPENPVHTYTQYYHAYAAQTKEYQQALDRESDPQLRANWKAHVDWAQYHADQSSRAAHYFHQNPNTSQPPPFDLPPTPQQQQQQNSQQSTQAASGPSQVQQTVQNTQLSSSSSLQYSQANAASSSSNDQAPSSLKDYVHRCMLLCQTEEEKKSAMGKVQEKISIALQAGTLHSQDWSQIPLVQLESSTSPAAAQAPVNGSSNSQGPGYYGPASSAPQAGARTVSQSPSWGSQGSNGTMPQPARRNSGAGTSYYGPTNSSTQDFNRNRHNLTTPSSSKHNSYNSRLSNRDPSPGLTSAEDQQYNYYGPPKSKNKASNTLSRKTSKQQANMSPKGRKNIVDDMNVGKEDFVPFSSNGNGYKGSSQMNQAAFLSKKRNRKNSGFDESDSKLSNRAKRFAGAGGLDDAATVPKKVEGENVDRFMGKGVIVGAKEVLDEADFEQMTVKGTCRTLEKEYLRLTAPPRPEFVRPQDVLEEHLESLLGQRNAAKAADSKSESASGQDIGNKKIPRVRDYLWFCSQLKAIRQDLTVQRIQNSFTVRVYETHARMALEEDDLNEYNQCQTQLKELYEVFQQRLKGNPNDADALKATRCQNEFVAYRLIYYVLLTGNAKYDGGSSDLFKIMLSLTTSQRSNPAVRHALAVREAVSANDYHTFFSKLWVQAPNMGRYLMQHIVGSLRFAALERLVKAYRPTCPVDFCLQEIGWGLLDRDKDDDSKETSDMLMRGRDYLRSCGCVLSEDEQEIVSKDSVVRESDWGKENASSLI